MDNLDEQMIPFSAEQIANNEKKMNMTLDDIIKLSKKTACYNPRKSRAYSNKKKNVFGGDISNVRSSRKLRPASKQNKRQKHPTARAPSGNSTSVWSRLKFSKSSVRQGLATGRYLNLHDAQFHIVRAEEKLRNTTKQKRSFPKQKQSNSTQNHDSFCAYGNARQYYQY